MKIIFMYMAPDQGQTMPWGQNFYININLLSIWSFAASHFPLYDLLTVFPSKHIGNQIQPFCKIVLVNGESSFI